MKAFQRLSTRLMTLALAAAASLVALGTANAVVIANVTGGFKGTTQVDVCALNQCFRPPDTMGAVGTTQFLETTNGANTVYDKNTGAILSRKSMTQWWADIGLPRGAFGDQRVLFDHYTNRWMAIGFGNENGTFSGNTLNIAVSSTNNAMGAWQTTKIIGASVGIPATVLDYPTLAMDDKGVYIGTNNFNVSNDLYTGSSMFVIPKASLFGGAPNLASMTVLNVTASGGNTPQAALNWAGNPGNTAAVMTDSNVFNAQAFFVLNGVNAPGATQSPKVEIAGTGYNTPVGDGRQPDGSRKVDTLSPRITANAVQYNGRVYSTHTVRSTVGDFAEVRWNVVDAVTGALLSQGQIGGGGFDYYQGSIAINEFGEAVIGYNRSGFAKGDGNGDGLDDGNISFMARAFTVGGGGGLVQVGGEMLLKASLVSDYHCDNRANPAPCPERWGDYAAVSIDPTDHHDFFAIGEYAEDWATLPNTGGLVRANWATYIAEIEFGNVDPPPGGVPEPAPLALLVISLLAWRSTRRTQAH